MSSASGRAPVVGVLAGRFRFVRFGDGPAPLAILPGMSLLNRMPGRLTASAYVRGLRRLAEGHTVYVVQRPTGLPAAASTADIAAEYAPVLASELGSFRLLGLSTGGLVAQHLALDHPASVERLALVVTGARLAESGRAICDRWLELAAAQRWRAVHGELAASAVDGRALQGLARAVGAFSGRPSAREIADFATTVSAVLVHDSLDRLPALRAPTLVVGGALDPFFPDDVLRATAAALPDATLRVFASSGHGLPKHRSGELQDEVATFLAGR